MPKLTEKTLRHYTGSLAYFNGEINERFDAVKDMAVFHELSDFGEPVTGLSASVELDHYPFYAHPEAWLDPDTGELTGAWCDCGDFDEYEGLCEHCVSLLLHYLRHPSGSRTGMYESRTEEGGFTRPVHPTEPVLAQLLQKFGERELLSIGEEQTDPVHLEVTLNLDYRGTQLSFRIGITKLYVVKDVYEMIDRVRNVEEFSYGKNLTFVHRPEAFDEESRPIIEFLLCQYESFDRYGSWYRPKGRYFELTSSQLDEFLDLAGKAGILLSRFRDAPERWTMEDGSPPWELAIRWQEGGASLDFDRPERIQTSSYNYYFSDHTIYRLERRSRQAVEEFEDYLYSEAAENNFISEEDLPLFVRQVLPILETFYTIQDSESALGKYLPEEASFRIYLDLPQDDLITCDLVAVYADGSEYHVFAGVPQKGSRNVRQEMEVSARVSRYCNAFDKEACLAVASADDACMYTLLTEGIPEFRDLGEVFISDRLKRITEIRRPVVSVGVSLSGNLLNLEISSGGLSMEELAAVLSKYDRKKRFYRLNSGTFVSMEDDNLDTLAQVKKGLLLTDSEMADGHVQVPKFRALFLDEQLRENEGIPVEKSRDFKALIRQMHTVEDSDYEIPKPLDNVLRGYQKSGFRWIRTLYANGFGGILADDMGLGKTLQVITFLLAQYRETEGPLRTLIVCPASLVYNWENECRQFAPELPVQTAAGTTMERKALFDALPERIIVITSYDLLKRDIDRYQGMDFAFQIIDEAQFIKNANTKAAHAVKMVPSGFRMALTGTPVENRLSELWSIFDYLMPGYLGRYQQFRDEIELPVVQQKDEDALQRIQKLIAPFVLRRLKKDVLRDLPDKLERNMIARMSGEQKQLYEAHVQRLQLFLNRQSGEEFAHSKIEILAELTKLRQLCCDPALLYQNYTAGSAKLDLCLQLTRNAIEAGHKILIFSQFTSMLDRIAGQLDAAKIRYYMLTGSTSKKERMRLVDSFNQDDTPVFCISLKAGGTGLNLTAADIVIHYDPWWNTAAQNQATDRTHRIGQKNVVTVYRLIAKDTIEEKIVQLQEKKQELADQVLGSGSSVPVFDKEELLELLSARI